MKSEKEIRKALEEMIVKEERERLKKELLKFGHKKFCHDCNKIVFNYAEHDSSHVIEEIITLSKNRLCEVFGVEEKEVK